MAISDLFKGSQYKTELEALQQECTHLKSLLNPESQEALALRQELLLLRQNSEQEQQKLANINNDITMQNRKFTELLQEIEQKKNVIVWLDDEILVQEFGLYKPQFDFATALDYKEALSDIRTTQKNIIKNNNAVTGNLAWQVNGSSVLGRKMVTNTQKLLLRAFNSECDELVNGVKYTNFDASLGKMYKSAEAISKLGEVMSISISKNYLFAKEKELRLAFEYQIKKQQEKEALKEARAEQREQAKVQKELEDQRRKLEKEQNHYQVAFIKLQAQLETDSENKDLLIKKLELENQLLDIDKALSDVDYRQANMKAGYVYIISNIGAFGENVYKIGMTRRLEPQERVDELGDASVPFNFDVHAMIFSDDAPALEAALHKAFEDKKLNMVNQRREFFNVTLDEIKEVIRKNYDKTVEFIDTPDAEQYRISKKLKVESI